LAVAAGVVGCGPTFPYPLTAADVASFDSGAALVTYLGQRDASPSVCDTRSPSSHIGRFDRFKVEALISGLDEGKIDPELWQRCIAVALDSGPPSDAALIVDGIARGYRQLATDDAIDTSPAIQARIAALQAAYIERPAGKNGDALEMAANFGELRRKFLARRLSPVATRFVGEILGVVDLEQGRYGGRPVDATLIGEVAARGDENLLRRFADRLPSQEPRDQARRGLIRLHIAASPFPEVRAQAAPVEERVLREGANRISLAEQRAVRATFDESKLPGRIVLARQDVVHQTAALLGFAAAGGLSVIPSLSLVGALWVEVAGLSRPVTVCQAPSAFDPNPCVAASDVTIENSTASIDGRGSFQFRERLTEAELIGLTGARSWFPLAIDVGGKQMVALRWPLRFERPDALRLGGGPALKVAIRRPDPSLYTFTVTSGGAVYRAIVEKSDLGAFQIASVGTPGTPGQDGSDGMDGMAGSDGTSASCPSMSGGSGGSGSNGSSGGNGGDGSDGGDGGNVQVEYDCGAATCAADDVAMVRQVVVSEGGRGGSGGRAGRGGKGGRAGRGGASASCTDANGHFTSVSGGLDGMSGTNGSDGFSGHSGRTGQPGKVTFRVVASSRS